MWFEDIYSWKIFDYMKKGTKVFALDRKTRSVSTVNDMTVARAFELVELAKDDLDRFVFWIEIKEEEENVEKL